MLWYKSWLETKPRFLASLASLTLFCGVFVYHSQSMIRPKWTADLNLLLFVNQQFLVIMWVMSVVLLGMGGVIREKSLGTSSYTLSLPVSRIRLLLSRVGVGVVEAILLAVLPWLGVFAVMRIERKQVLLTQVASYIVLLVAGGLVFFAMAVLISSIVAGEYTAPALAFGVALLVIIISDSWFHEYSIWRLVTGDLSIDRSTYLLPGHLPWSGLGLSLFFALSIMAAAVYSLQKRDF